MIRFTPERLLLSCIVEDGLKGGCLGDSGETRVCTDVSQGGHIFSAPSPPPFSLVSSHLGWLSLKLPRNFMIPWSFPSGNKSRGLKEGEVRAVMTPKGRTFSVVAFGGW